MPSNGTSAHWLDYNMQKQKKCWVSFIKKLCIEIDGLETLLSRAGFFEAQTQDGFHGIESELGDYTQPYVMLLVSMKR